jgi:hypothetical protein
LEPEPEPEPDAAVNVLAHELTETCTDPLGTGWCYNNGGSDCNGFGVVENADQCDFYFPGVSTGDNYNIQVGDLNYLIQAIWNLYYQDCLIYY